MPNIGTGHPVGTEMDALDHDIGGYYEVAIKAKDRTIIPRTETDLRTSDEVRGDSVYHHKLSEICEGLIHESQRTRIFHDLEAKRDQNTGFT
jgi:hypothetical protein